MPFDSTDRSFPPAKLANTLPGARLQADSKVNWVYLLTWPYLYHLEGKQHGSPHPK